MRDWRTAAETEQLKYLRHMPNTARLNGAPYCFWAAEKLYLHYIHHYRMKKTIRIAVLLALLAFAFTPAPAQKQKEEKAAKMPRFHHRLVTIEGDTVICDMLNAFPEYYEIAVYDPEIRKRTIKVARNYVHTIESYQLDKYKRTDDPEEPQFPFIIITMKKDAVECMIVEETINHYKIEVPDPDAEGGVATKFFPKSDVYRTVDTRKRKK